jgi:hypothetical protein
MPSPSVVWIELARNLSPCFCVRDATTGEIKHANSPITGGLPHDFLEGAWDVDILSQKGFNIMKEVVGEIVTNTSVLERA